jgi:hypothetical protein
MAMAAPRFATAQELIGAFPFARYDLTVAPTEQPPVDFIKSLAAAGNYRDAISCCAYLLPRREAVWWACHCVRAARVSLGAEERAALDAAEAWVGTPEEDFRQAALAFGVEEPTPSPAMWACRAAALSGGVVSQSSKGPIRAQPEATARAARAAVLIAVTKVESGEQDQYLKSCVEECLRLVRESGNV